jgi:Ni/Fe-hydrogenase subunit HybB-like protein
VQQYLHTGALDPRWERPTTRLPRTSVRLRSDARCCLGAGIYCIGDIIGILRILCSLDRLATVLVSWNLNRTIGWGWDITNFVWWVGIGHAGTLISAILLLFRQKWRTGVNRAAEAMTIFAVICAGQFPLIHMGRLWLAIFIFPYPNTRGPLWVNFQLTTFVGRICDLHLFHRIPVVLVYRSGAGFCYRSRPCKGLAPKKCTTSSLLVGRVLPSTGSVGRVCHLVLAGLATPLVLSVHTIVSFDFATSVIPGWHTTIFPPYFVAGAIFSGFAMVQTLMVNDPESP